MGPCFQFFSSLFLHQCPLESFIIIKIIIIKYYKITFSGFACNIRPSFKILFVKCAQLANLDNKSKVGGLKFSSYSISSISFGSSSFTLYIPEGTKLQEKDILAI